MPARSPSWPITSALRESDCPRLHAACGCPARQRVINPLAGLRLEPEWSADIWIRDLMTGALRNLTLHPDGDFLPSWSPDGQGRPRLCVSP
jgi:hypothetical protein